MKCKCDTHLHFFYPHVSHLKEEIDTRNTLINTDCH